MPRSVQSRVLRVLGLAAATVVAGAVTDGLAGTSGASDGSVPQMSLLGLTTLSQTGQFRINPAGAAARSLTVLPIDSPPINGFQPLVVYGLTTEQDKNGNFLFMSQPSSNPASQPATFTLPVFGTPHYEVAIFDTGSQAHLITHNAFTRFDVVGANRDGIYQQPITGVNGSEITDISDALGIYATGFANATGHAGGTISVTAGTLKGQWNCPVLSTEATSSLPNLIGSPMSAHWQAVIRPSQTRSLTVGSTTYSSPSVTFQTLNTAAPQNYYRLTLNAQSANGVSPDPAYIPSLDNFNNWADNPTSPGFWASLTARANATHTAGSSGMQDFLFDTGAEVTVVSEDTAAAAGFYTGGPNPSTPDFYVEVAGVGGTTAQVPGFYMNSLSVNTNGGPVTWTHVPVLVLNIPDPTDFIGFIPGVLGMNLFSDRDMIVNGGLSNPFVAFSEVILPQWIATGGGSWSEHPKWSLGAPNGPDLQANFLSAITAPSTVTVDAQGFTVGSMKFDNANQYTIDGPGTITIEAQSTGVGAVTVVSGSHKIQAPVKLNSNTTINVIPSTSTLTMNGTITATGKTITKIGAGAAVVNNVRSGGLNVNAGLLQVALNGGNSGTSRVGTLGLGGGTLDLNDNDLIVTSGTYTAITNGIKNARNGGLWNQSGITSSAARDANPKNRTLGTLTGAEFKSIYGGSAQFDGFDVANTDVLVKFTWYGDTDFNGVINFDDYGRTDTGFNQGRTGWLNGDFDYSGGVNFDDYALIDLAFNTQSGTLRRAMQWLDGGGGEMNEPSLKIVEQHYWQFGPDYAGAFLSAVPEPGGIGLLMTGVFAAVSRRRRRTP